MRAPTLVAHMSDPGNWRQRPLIRRGGGDTLTLSMRRVNDLVAFCAPYEFEDVIGATTGADRIEPMLKAPIEWARRAYRLARRGTGSRALARKLTPAPHSVRLDRDYELFFPIFNHAHELFALSTVSDWRKRSRRAACFVNELWAEELPGYLIELLADFDHVFVGVQHPVSDIARMTGRPCTYLPLAADVLTFAPSEDGPPRTIDVCNIGRRSATTHAALLKLARARRLTYYYDTVAASGDDLNQRTFRVSDAAEHRLLLATLLQRSRFFVTNLSRINQPEFTKGRDEISARFYEGAAAGAVMIGQRPRNEEFDRQFDWEDAVIDMPFDAPDVGEFIAQLESDPSRIERASACNVRQAALRHDWLRRIEVVFATLGLAPTDAMRARAAALVRVAERHSVRDAAHPPTADPMALAPSPRVVGEPSGARNT